MTITKDMLVSWRNHALISALLTVAGSLAMSEWLAAAFAAWGYTFREAGQVIDYWPNNNWTDHVGDVLSSVIAAIIVAWVI